MRILILGGDGMLGHQLLKHLAPRHDARVTLRLPLHHYTNFALFDATIAYGGIELRSTDPLIPVLGDLRPEVVINAAGIVKQRPTAEEAIPSLEINALLPHRLAVLCRAIGARLVHISTDCVFSGKTGPYTETAFKDGDAFYDRTKAIGEICNGRNLTINDLNPNTYKRWPKISFNETDIWYSITQK